MSSDENQTTRDGIWHLIFLVPCVALVFLGQPIGWLLIGMWVGRFM